jgi:hypothetical protein
MLDFWTSDTVFKPVLTSTAFSLTTTAPLTGNHFYTSSLRHRDKALPIFQRTGHQDMQYIVAQAGAVILMFPPFLS